MSHISYSEIKNWAKCPFYHKLLYIDGLKAFEGNLYTSFGTAIHAACEKVQETTVDKLVEIFLTQFSHETSTLKEYDTVLHEEMKKQGPQILEHVATQMADYFGKFEVLAVEEELYENIPESTVARNFKGFIDMVIRSGDTIHIIDWKTSTRGWSNWQKNDIVLKYQLLYYKHYYAQKYNLAPEDIHVHFGILKRIASGQNRVELMEIVSDEKKITESLNYMRKFLYNVDNKKYVKNRLSCKFCEFSGTEHCSN
jgi:hypothetical protein